MPNFISGGETGVSSEKLKLLAKVASNRFLEGKVPLTKSIQKLADENGLNTHQVARVAEMANHQTHAALWSTESDKAKVAFEVADPAKVSAKPAEEKKPTGKVPAAPMKSDKGPSTAELFGVNPCGGHEGLLGSDKKKIIVIIEKQASAKAATKDDLIKAAMMVEHEEKNLYKLVKQAYLGYGLKLDKIYEAAYSEGLGEIALEYMPKIAKQLHAETGRAELEKLAFKAPESLIDFDVPITIVNGAHPVLISLDTLLKYRNDIREFSGRMSRINDEVSILGERLRELE